MSFNTNRNTDIPKDVVSLSEFFPTVTCTPGACEIKTTEGVTITLTMAEAKEAARILKGMEPSKGIKGMSLYAKDAKQLTTKQAENFGKGLVAMAKVNERLAAEMLHQGTGSSIVALIPKA